MADFRADYSKFTVEDLGWDRVPFADVDKKVTDLMDFTGKTVIVTGAGGVGLGRALAHRFAALIIAPQSLQNTFLRKSSR